MKTPTLLNFIKTHSDLTASHYDDPYATQVLGIKIV